MPYSMMSELGSTLFAQVCLFECLEYMQIGFCSYLNRLVNIISEIVINNDWRSFYCGIQKKIPFISVLLGPLE